MTATSRDRHRRGRRRFVRFALTAAGLLLAFAIGIALGNALDDNPRGITQTRARTLVPTTVPAERETVTVTVTSGTG